MVSMCLPSNALLQHLPSYLGFSYLGRGVSLHSCSSKAKPLLLTLDEGYLLTASPPDLEHGISPLGTPVSVQPLLLGREVALPSLRPWPRVGVAPPGCCPWRWMQGSSSRLLLCTGYSLEHTKVGRIFNLQFFPYSWGSGKVSHFHFPLFRQWVDEISFGRVLGWTCYLPSLGC